MRVLFVGGLMTDMPNYDAVKQNIKNLVILMSKHNTQFVVRDWSPEDNKYSPIDSIVVEALTDLQAKNLEPLGSNTLMIIREAGVNYQNEISIRHVSMATTALNRGDFYRELLENVDLVVGAGGQHGLLRLGIVCEYCRKQIFYLPGTGGTADVLWTDYLRKSVYTQHLSKENITRIKSTPYANVANASYAETIYDLITYIHTVLSKKLPKDDIYTLDGITIIEIAHAVKRMSLGAWFTIVSLLMAVVSIAYYFGSIELVKTILR